MTLPRIIRNHSLDSFPKNMREEIGFHELSYLHSTGTPISSLVLYDEFGAKLAKDHEIEVVVASYSYGTPAGCPDEHTATLDDVIKATRTIRRHNDYSFLVADIPLSVYRSRTWIDAASRLKSAGADAVKIEGGLELGPLVRELQRRDIPFVGHIGYMPKTGMPMALRGKTDEDKACLIADALALKEAGAAALVLELVEDQTATAITREIGLPTFGVYSGVGTSAQVLVLNDILDLTRFDAKLFPKGKPKSVGQWQGTPAERVSDFRKQVRAKTFPQPRVTRH